MIRQAQLQSKTPWHDVKGNNTKNPILAECRFFVNIMSTPWSQRQQGVLPPFFLIPLHLAAGLCSRHDKDFQREKKCFRPARGAVKGQRMRDERFCTLEVSHRTLTFSRIQNEDKLWYLWGTRLGFYWSSWFLNPDDVSHRQRCNTCWTDGHLRIQFRYLGQGSSSTEKFQNSDAGYCNTQVGWLSFTLFQWLRLYRGERSSYAERFGCTQ